MIVFYLYIYIYVKQTENTVGVSASYKAVSASLKVDMDKFNSQLTSTKKFGIEHSTFEIGSESLKGI